MGDTRCDNLSTHPQTELEELRQSVHDLVDEAPDIDDDQWLMRWLKARQFDVKSAEQMLREDVKWRRANKVDSILRDFQPPKVMADFFPGGLHGHDKDGHPIWFDPVGNIDLKGILMSIRKQDVIKSKVWLMEEIQRKMKDMSQELGRRIDQIVVIFDLENLGTKHLWKPGIDLFQEIATTFESHYPELLKKAYLINAPTIFPVVFNLVRPFLHEDTRGKVVVCGKNYQELLLQDIDADQLPVHWGGKSVDANGDSRCRSVIVPGGEVPTSCYGNSSLDEMSGFKTITLGRGSSFQTDLYVSKPYSFIRWQFMTDRLDVGFGVYRRTNSEAHQKTSDMECVLSLSRVNSQLLVEDGTVECVKTGTYVIHFDNSFSWIKSKKLSYLVEVLEPSHADSHKENNNKDLSETAAES